MYLDEFVCLMMSSPIASLYTSAWSLKFREKKLRCVPLTWHWIRSPSNLHSTTTGLPRNCTRGKTSIGSSTTFPSFFRSSQLPAYLRPNLLSTTFFRVSTASSLPQFESALYNERDHCTAAQVQTRRTVFALLRGSIPSADPTQGKCVWFTILRRYS